MDKELKDIIKNYFEDCFKFLDEYKKNNIANFDPENEEHFEIIVNFARKYAENASNHHEKLNDYKASNENNALIKCKFDGYLKGIEAFSESGSKQEDKKQWMKGFKEVYKNVLPENMINNVLHEYIQITEKQKEVFSEKELMRILENPKKRKELQDNCHEEILKQDIAFDYNNTPLNISTNSKAKQFNGI